MWLGVSLLGIGCIGYGAWLKVKRMDEWDSEESMEMYRGQIDHHREEFLNQFRLSQESISSLYAEDLTDLKEQLLTVSMQLNQIQAMLRENELERQLEGVMVSPKQKHQLKQMMELEQMGLSDDQIARELKMGLGEVLLLKQMRK